MTTAVRDTIADRYHLLSRVSAGGMGEIYRARDTVLGRIVAIKVLPEALSLDPEFVERFRSEAQVAAQLSHPNVVHVYDWGRWESIHYMVMEYVRGRNLRSILGDHGSLSPRQSLEVMAQTLAGLAAAHASGLVHRDVKPENVLVATDGTVKVADFGIARAAETTATAGMFGTVAYVSPEQVRGESVDGRSDIYSAGCVLYELVCGLPPFSGDGASVLHNHLHEKVPAPSSEHPDVPDEIDEIVARATARDVADRYSTSEGMLADVRKALSHSEEAATPLSDLVAEVTSEVSEAGVPTLARAEPRRIRRVGLIALAAGLLAFLVMAALLWRPVRVPEVVGMGLSEATDALESAGLDQEVVRMSSDQPPDTVIDASHPPGDWTLKGRSVELTVSLGPPLTTVPDLTGMDLAEAREELEGARLIVGDIAFVFSPEPQETVVAQEPGPGRARQGVPVNLTVSRGPEVVEIPKVVGRPFAEALPILKQAGFEVARSDIFHDSEEGTIVRQTPQGGKRAEKGSRVTVQVSKGPEPFDMPDVDGEECSTAKDELEELGLVVVIRSQADSACGSNRVLDQDPLPGTEVRKGDEATLYVE